MRLGNWIAFSALSLWIGSRMLSASGSAAPSPPRPLPAYTVVDMETKEPVVLGRFRVFPEFVSSGIHPDMVGGKFAPGERAARLRRISHGFPIVGSFENWDEQSVDGRGLRHRSAFVFQNGILTYLGTLPGGTESVSSGLNHNGLVVGWSNVSPGGLLHHAFLYSHGKMIDLNTRIPAHSGWVLEEASDINDLGQITGVGSHRGAHYLFLLTPTNLTPDQATQVRKLMEDKKRADDDMGAPRSNLERLGPVAAHILGGTTRVETFRVKLSEKLAVSDPQIEGTLITATGPVLGETAARQISAVLRDPKPYRILSQPACRMLPAVVFRVRQGKSYVDVVICFHCGQLVVLGYDDTGHRVSDMYGLMTTDEIRIFKAIAKQAFPQDAVIQAL